MSDTFIQVVSDAQSIKGTIIRMMQVAAQADDFEAAQNLLDALGGVYKSVQTLQVRADPEFIRWGLNHQERLFVKGNEFISAVRSIRARTGVSLKEAKDKADAYRTHIESSKSGHSNDTNAWGLTQEEMRLVRSDAYINAIKELRARAGLSLAEAKSTVDAYREHLYQTNVLERPKPWPGG